MKSILYTFLILFVFTTFVKADDDDKPKEVHNFKILHNVECTDVKSQARTGTCWSFSTSSFIESELIRLGFGKHDISEMYTVRMTYPLKADKYVRYHGKHQFSAGGQAHDVTNIIREFGMVPEEVYNGRNYGWEDHNHSELDAALKGMIDGILKKGGKKLTPVGKMR